MCTPSVNIRKTIEQCGVLKIALYFLLLSIVEVRANFMSKSFVFFLTCLYKPGVRFINGILYGEMHCEQLFKKRTPGPIP